VFTRLAARITKRPGAALVLCLLGTFLAAWVGGSAPGRLGDAPGAVDDFADVASESWITAERLDRERSDTGVELLVVVDLDATWPAPSAVSRVDEVKRELEDVGGINTVTGPVASGPGVPAEAVAASEALVSEDGSSALLTVTLDKGVDGDDLMPQVADRFDDQQDVAIGGSSAVESAVNEQVGTDLARAEMFAFPLLFLVSIWVFRSIIGAAMPLLVGGATIMLAFVGLAVVDAVAPMSIFAINLVFAISLGLAVDYSLLLVTRMREARALGHQPRPAVFEAVRGTATTIVFSACTVAAAMAALTVFPQRFVWSMGVGGILSAIAAAIVSLTLLPALLALLGDRIDLWQPRRWREAALRDAQGTEHGFWGTTARIVMRRPALFALIIGGVLLLAASPVARISFTGVDSSVLPASSEARIATERVQEEFPLVAAEQLTVVAEDETPEAVDRAVADAIAALPEREQQVLGTVSRATIMEYDGKRSALVTANIEVEGEPLSDEARGAARSLRASLDDSINLVGVVGETTETIDQLESFADNAPAAIAIGAIATFVLVFLFTGSVVLPLKAILMNTLSVMIALAMLVLVFQDGRFEDLLGYTSQGAVEASQPLLIIAIAFGLSTDYGIMLLGRIREERERGLSDFEAVAVGIQRTGRIITCAAILLSIALGAFITSQIVFIQQIGVGTVTAVIVDATIVRAILVPSLMALLGRWNWWAPAPLRALHRRIGIREVHTMSPPSPG
jgi:uncharacterized membrane protein YdfJ with MMPL/SSD domain